MSDDLTGFAGLEGIKPDVTVGQGNPEAVKYGEMWKHDAYRANARGEVFAPEFLRVAHPRPGASVIDFGCGTGRPALLLATLGGLNVTMVDFVRNCLDADIRPMLEAQAHTLRFVKADLEAGPLPTGEYGFCTEVMEHIPPDRVDRVLNNILCAARHVFFSISTVDDSCGELIGAKLHLTVQPYLWWLQKFHDRGAVVHWSQDVGAAALFYVSAWSTGRTVADSGALNIEEQKALDNIRTNTGPRADGRQWQHLRPYPGRSDEAIMIVGSGPTLNEFEAEIIAHIDRRIDPLERTVRSLLGTQ